MSPLISKPGGSSFQPTVQGVVAGPGTFVGATTTFPGVQPGAKQPSGGVAATAGPGQVSFASSDPPLSLVCKLGEDAATPSGGAGGWETFDRPGRKQGQEWKGLPLRELSVPVLFDALQTRESVEPEVQTLRQMARPKDGPRGTLPPVLTLGGMVPHDNLRWVITDLQFGEQVWSGMYRTRVWVTVSLREWEPVDLVVVTAASAPLVAAKTYTIKKGDTLGDIARREMGARTSAEIEFDVAEIKKLNGIRDSKSLKTGQKIKLPPKRLF